MTPSDLLTRYAAMLSQPSVTFLAPDGSLCDFTRVLARIKRELTGPDADGHVEGCHRELVGIAREVREARG